MLHSVKQLESFFSFIYILIHTAFRRHLRVGLYTQHFTSAMILEIVSSLSVIAVTLYGLQALIGHLRFRREINKVPGLNGWPLIGDALVLTSDPAGESECRQFV